MKRSWWLAALLLACGDDSAPDDARDDATDAELATPDAVETSDGADDTASDAEADGAASETAETLPETIDTADDSGGETSDDVDVRDGANTVEDTAGGSTEALDPELEPCDFPEYWPFSIRSEKVPLRVHYRMPGDAATARETLGILELSWAREVDGLGFAAPLLDEGTCGGDDAIDIFTWRGAEVTYVNIWAENDATPWDDGFGYMIVDPWGEYGGDELPVTLAHEFNHLCQSAHDWSDAAFIYEATSTFIEDEVYDGHNSYRTLLFDFQGNPDWSLDHDDGYATWYMYGAGLWLRYVRDRFFKGDASFVADLWLGMRSPWDDNEPDYVDSIDGLLADFGVSFADTVIEFARWRWYVGERDDGLHLEEAGAFPRDALPRVAATLQASGGRAVVRPMMLGTSYIDIVASAGGPEHVRVSLETNVAADEVHWVVQALPGLSAGSDGDTLRLPSEVPLGDGAGRRVRTIAVTALPGIGSDIDPDERGDQRFSATLVVEPL